MGLSTKKSTTENTPGWSTPPSTPQSTKLENMVGTADFSAPIRNQYARAEAENNRSYLNPLGAYTTSDVRDKAKREQALGLHQNLGMALGDAALQNQVNSFNQQGLVAQLMQPRFYNAKSTTKESDPLGTALQIAGLGTSIALGGFGGGAGGKRGGGSGGMGTGGGAYTGWGQGYGGTGTW